MAEHGDVWVYAEQDRGELNGVALELLTKARELADTLGSRACAVLIGKNVEPLTKDLFAHGADVVYLAEHEALDDYVTRPYAKTMVDLVREYKPEIVLYGATIIGRDLAPRIASDLQTGLTADCTDLQIGDYEDKRAKNTFKDILYQIRPAFGGNIMATIVGPEHRPQMATVREGVMQLGERDNKRSGEVIRYQPALTDEDMAVKIVDKVVEAKPIDLRGARVIVAGGAGVGSRDNFKLIEQLADTLGGVVGASRAAVDSGYADKAHQVGQTGTTVRPALYIACGISGQIQHRAGMQEAGKIVAIDIDPQAPIFQIAHYAICGNLHQVIPMMIKAYRSRGQE